MTTSGAKEEHEVLKAVEGAEPGGPGEARALDTALEALMAELAEASTRRDRAGHAVEAARREHATLLAAANRLLCVLPHGPERERWEGRLETAAAVESPGAGMARRAGGGAREPAFRPVRRSSSPRMAAVHRFLALEGRSAFRTVELQIHLTMMGFDLPARAAPNICRTLAKQGLITRIDHALYAINRGHPALMEVELLEMRTSS
ncbi:MAG: hypothetical protein AAF160_12980 [Pseudomonadota bacterium]